MVGLKITKAKKFQITVRMSEDRHKLTICA